MPPATSGRDTLKFSVTVPGLTLFQGLGGQPAWARDITTDQIVAIVRRADELGYDFLPVPWHLAMSKSDAENFGPRWPDSRSATGFLLGATRRIAVQPLFVAPCEEGVRNSVWAVFTRVGGRRSGS